MTIWLPDMAGRSGPKYRAIADAIIDGIEAGDLADGAKLPPQRNLAYDLGVTLGTVTRAYQEVERAGFARGQVGRGTFVLPPEDRRDARLARERMWYGDPARTFDPSDLPVDNLSSDPPVLKDGYELAANYPNLAGTTEVIAESMRRVARPDLLGLGLQYHADNGLPHHRAAAVRWMRAFGIEADAADVLVTPGAQSATQTALIALTRPGDTVLAEWLTWPGLKASATPLGLALKGVDMDEFGMRPDAFDAACRRHTPKAAYVLPTLHNPTAGSMPEARRREIVEIARRHEVYLIEDDIYGFLIDAPLPPLHVMAPDRTVYVTGLSKAVAPGLRLGYTVVPDGLMPKFLGAMRTNVLMASSISCEIGTDLIQSGAATAVANRQRDEIRARQELVGRRLGDLGIRAQDTSSHCWMPVPESFADETTFRARLMERGVQVSPGSVFAIDEAMPLNEPHVRLCLGAEGERARLDQALKIISDVARTDLGAATPVV